MYYVPRFNILNPEQREGSAFWWRWAACPFCTNPKDKGIAEEFEKLSRRRLEGGE